MSSAEAGSRWQCFFLFFFFFLGGGGGGGDERDGGSGERGLCLHGKSRNIILRHMNRLNKLSLLLLSFL